MTNRSELEKSEIPFAQPHNNVRRQWVLPLTFILKDYQHDLKSVQHHELLDVTYYTGEEVPVYERFRNPPDGCADSELRKR
jgi:hypothetical protein